MVSIEEDSRFKNDKWFEVNGKRIGLANHYSFDFCLDVESGNIYSNDTDRAFSIEEFVEFANFIRDNYSKCKK